MESFRDVQCRARMELSQVSLASYIIMLDLILIQLYGLLAISGIMLVWTTVVMAINYKRT